MYYMVALPSEIRWFLSEFHHTTYLHTHLELILGGYDRRPQFSLLTVLRAFDHPLSLTTFKNFFLRIFHFQLRGDMGMVLLVFLIVLHLDYFGPLDLTPLFEVGIAESTE